MGFLQASEMAERLPLNEAVRWHLTSNHFPPLGEEWLLVALQAIEHVEEDDQYFMVDLPKGVTARDSGYGQMAAIRLVAALHLEAFLTPAEDYDAEP